MAIRIYRCLALAGAGLATGIAYGSFRLTVAEEYDPDLPSMPDPDRLPRMLEANPLEEPAVRNVVVFPVQSVGDRAQLVTGELRRVEYRPNGSKVVRWEPVKAWVSIPIASEGSPSLERWIEQLDAAGRIIPDVTVAWWRRPRAFILACGSVGALGLGTASLVLDRVRAKDRASAAEPGIPCLESEEPSRPPGMTFEDRVQLAAAIEALSPALDAPENSIATAPDVARPIARFDCKGLATRPGTAFPASEKHYEGEYYPVEKSAKHPS